ncbi:Iota-carrageenase precursor [Planctomycetes bacterium CA13]|uniref:Iota-carrageenase n=1 Tax=Novipirellula herctigrandis TaxID=2527986 RepID=A0A5C5Z0K4_9BACT|nr:Iota-carrageenase precursor [Planctomycetes bacterium CA13]
MAPTGLTKNLKADYGLVDDDAKNNQSETFRKAIADLAAKGGGRLIVPKGTYRLANVRLMSNIHLLIEKDTVIKPDWPKGSKTVVFSLDAEQPKKMTKGQEGAFIENVSIRGLGGRWTVDYSDRFPNKGEGVRGVLGRMVKNFLISDMDVKDNCTVYCGMTLSPTNTNIKDVTKWEVSRATDGTIRNCRIFNGSPGYGLVQLHGAQNVHFEDLYADGGVTLRLETGAVGLHTGVYNITGKNIVCENGRCAVMMGPHSAVNGKVNVENVTTRGCTYAVQLGLGGVKEAQLKLDPHAKPGSFAKGSSIKNIHAEFGMNAQLKKHSLQMVPEANFKHLRLWYDSKFFSGPSIAPVYDGSEARYEVIIENVTSEGFEHDEKIVTAEDARPGKWSNSFDDWKSEYGIKEVERPVPVKN